MIEIKKKHIREGKDMYLKNKNFFIKGVPFLKNMSEEERIEVFAEMFAECEQKMKAFRKKYPNGLTMDIKELKCDMEPIDWGFEKT